MYQAKVFFKNKVLVLLLLLMIITTIIPLAYFVFLGAEVSYNFYIVTRFIVFESILFMLLSYLFLIMDRKSKIGESILAITHNRKAYFLNSLKILMIIFVSYNLLILVSLFVNALLTGEITILISLIQRNYLLNILFPQLIVFMITIVLSQFEHFTLSTGLLIAFILLMSPYIEVFEWRYEPIIPIDKVLNVIRMPFSFFLQNSKFSMDSLYGFQNEKYKIFIALFWAVLSLCYLFKSQLSKHKYNIFIASLVLVLCLLQIYRPQSIYRIDNKWDGTYSDYNYYGVLDEKNIYKKTDCLESIGKYDLNITIDRQLSVSGTFDLKSPLKKTEYVVTLYRGYKIKNIKNSHLLRYKREGDYIYLSFKEPTDYEEVEIDYSGSHAICFSNNQAVQLPGYFCWYPMAGEREVYFNNNDITEVSYGMNVYNRNIEADYDIYVNCDYPIVTNLKKESKNRYVGKSDSLTVVGGYIDFFDSNVERKVLNYFPYKLSYFYTTEDYYLEISQAIDDVLESLKSVFDISSTEIDQKQIIICSEALSRTQIMGDFAEFEDYIIISEKNYISIQQYIFYKLANRFDLNPALVETLIQTDYFLRDKDVILQSIKQNVESQYSMYASSNLEGNKIKAEQYKNLKDQLKKDIEEIGNEGTMKKIGKIIMGEENEDYSWKSSKEI